MRKIIPDNSEIIIYQTADGLTKLDVQMQGENLWLNQAQMAELFGRSVSVISRHIKNIFAEEELNEKSNLQNMQIANSDRPVTFYSLDVILAVGYRVKSLRGTQFRQWATAVLGKRELLGEVVVSEMERTTRRDAMTDTTRQNITQHIDGIIKEGELQEEPTRKKFLFVQKEGNRGVKRGWIAA